MQFTISTTHQQGRDMLANIGTIMGLGLATTIIYLLIEDIVRRNKK